MERFLLFLQAKRVLRDEEDIMIWTVSKSGKFSVKFLYSVLELSDPLLFLWSIIWSSCVPPKMGFFFLGGDLGENLNFGPCLEEGACFDKQMFSLPL